MIAVLSPAKTLDYATPLPASIEPTAPRLGAEAETLAQGAAKLSKSRLGALMHISDKLAALNVDRFRGFAEQPERPALYAFAGDVYSGFEARTLEEPAIAFAQDHVRILSGLYGLLRPLDAMRPYRLEMGTRWAPGRAKDLYGWWQDRIADLLASDIAAEGSGTILNLASQEYWRAVAGKLPAGVRIIEVDFREPGPDGPRFVSFHAKKARGMMARWMCEHHIADAEAMRGFDSAGYRFDAAASEADRWTFVRSGEAG
ncbi:peroxide stress protein YaaA [Sphingosinithalassobacter sp. LHW66-3]|uniref:peroxide stress protein YaaA n=1 Tax=Sphingosinithalassobacter sp. LHW66-3 TaxID=3424718 RepID=UPI003D6AE5F5